MSDVSDWLNSLGLGRYAKAFEENEIELDVLPELDHEVLKDIGVTAAGHRLRLIKAAREVRAQSASPEEETKTSAPAPEQRHESAVAERRQLTVLFCDLVGSTQLAQTTDLEELRELNLAFQEAARGAIERHDGYVARYMGDGLLAYFGYPRAYEDAAERAVRAGLDAVASVSGIESRRPLAARVGIATGPVVVGDAIGSGDASERAAVGETPNLAARLQSLAEPDTVVIAEGTYALVGGLFNCTDLGTHSLKGFNRELQVWQVERERTAGMRFAATQDWGRTAFVGRSSELSLLDERWAETASGEGHVVLLEGEAGIGKSRLVDEFRRGISRHAHVSLGFQCSPHHVSATFAPFLRQLEQAAGFLGQDDELARLDKLEEHLRASDIDQTGVCLLASLLSLPTERYPPLNLQPTALKVRAVDALSRTILSRSEIAPVLAVVEDAHWIDPSSHEVISKLVDATSVHPLLLIVTYRPDFHPPWLGHSSVTPLRLNRMPKRDSEAIVRGVCQGVELPVELREQILARTDGVALFVEELTRAVLESHGSDAMGASTPSQRLPGRSELALPLTLYDSLMARLDRFAEEKEIALTAACIGREFNVELLETVCSASRQEIVAALEKLADSGLLFRRGTSEDGAYSFKHALVRDVAYDSLLRSRRRELHRAVLAGLEELNQDNPDAVIELLAHHAQLGEDWETAEKYSTQAGAKALARSALKEAVAHYENAARALEEQVQSHTGQRRGIELKLALRQCHFLLGDILSVNRCLDDAYSLAELHGDPEQRARIRVALSGAARMVGDSREGVRYAREALQIEGLTGDSSLPGAAHFYLGSALWGQGALLDAERALRQTLQEDLRRPTRERAGLAGTAGHPPSQARALLVWLLAEQGRFDEAYPLGQESIRLADAVGDPFTQAWARWALANLHGIRGEYDQAIALMADVRTIVEEKYLAVWPQFVGWSMGYFLALSGQTSSGVALAKEAYDLRCTGEVRWGHSLLCCHLGEALLADGQINEAKVASEEALTLARRWGEVGREAYALRLSGLVFSTAECFNGERAVNDLLASKDRALSLGMQPLVALSEHGLASIYVASGNSMEAQPYIKSARATYTRLGMRHHLTRLNAEVI